MAKGELFGKGRTWPSAGDRQVHCTLQYAIPVEDEGGGRRDPIWSDFGTWWVRLADVPFIPPNEIDNDLLYALEGPYRRDLFDYFNGFSRPTGVTLPVGFVGGLGIRIITSVLTLKVFQVQDVLLKHRTLIAYCANAAQTQ